MNNNLKLYKTKDGSNTLMNISLNEIYHSRNGAVTECKHVFINSGLNYFLEKKKSKLNIFEVGFGTGLNAILTYHYAKKANVDLFYYAIDILPIAWKLIAELEYDTLEIVSENIEVYKKLINSDWGSLLKISEKSKYFKEKIDFSEKVFTYQYDIIYFDAFAPNIQEEMWTEKAFQKLYKALNVNGILVTYCAKGSVKRSLQNAGFSIEKLPGPPGKREMIRAIK